jgi:hypothetical protein
MRYGINNDLLQKSSDNVKYANMGLLKYVGYDRLFVRAGGHDVGKE